MVSQEQKDLIIKLKEEGKTIAEISKITSISYNKIYYFFNKEIAKEHAKEYYNKNKKLIKKHKSEYNKEYYQKIKEKIKERRKEYMKEYFKANKEKKKEYDKNYTKRNKERIADRNRKYYATKSKTDAKYRIAKNLRNRIRIALNGKAKSVHTMELIGCSIEELKQYIETQFRDGMAWENYGTVWHIDHIIPCAAFDLTDKKQQRECFNYKNLQPLLAEENLSKNDFLPDGMRARYKK